jgi:hypothetical protein
MAAENTEPKSLLIIQIGLFAVVFLVAARFGLVSYFNVQMGDEYQAKIGNHKNEQLMKLRQEEQVALKGGAMSIDKAITMVATKSRAGLGDMMMPHPSSDTAAVVGWGQSPNPLPAAAASAAVADADAGVLSTSDGGAHMLSSGDAGSLKTDGGILRDASRSQATMAVPAPSVAPKTSP